MYIDSLNLTWYLVGAESKILKQFELQEVRQDAEACKCLKEVYDAIYPSGSQPAGIYGLPKIHKQRAANSTYDRGILKIFSGTSKFKSFSNDPTLNREGKLQHFLTI